MIESLCPDIDKKVVQNFIARMDDDYFKTFPPEEIATHIRMSSRLDSKHPVEFRITPAGNDTFEIVIVGFDYPSEFSIFCGLLSAFGLDIEAGDVYSFIKDPARPSARKIVDVFRASAKPGETFDETKQSEFQEEGKTLALLLAGGSIQEARERLNRFLVERVERMDEHLSGLLAPVEIHFDNATSPSWTVMEAESEDAFAFLYSVSNALAMRGIYIHKAKIRGVVGGQARDRFFIADRWGRKIEDTGEQDRLRTAVGMIKQFTRFLPAAPDPARAMQHFDRFLDKVAEEQYPDHLLSFLAHEEGMNLLAHLLGSSDYLWDDFLGIRFKDLVPLLEDLNTAELRPQTAELRAQLDAVATFEEKKRALNEFKDRQVFLIDAKHLLQPSVTLMDFSQALTDLADIVVKEAVRICYDNTGEQRGPFSVFALGKFGGGEMGYASDLELIFVHGGAADTATTAFFEALAKQVVESIEARNKRIFQIDLRLRPYGDAGLWCIPFAQFASYYGAEGEAVDFERQALIKLRWVAGDEALGRRVEAHRDAFTYSGVEWNSENALHLRRRQMRELSKPGQINVKYSAGGIVDIEYAVQYLQLLHGKDHAELRRPNTLEALEQLRRLKIVVRDEYEVWQSSYLFLRNLIDALRIVRGDASDLVLPPAASDEFKSLARRLGYAEKDRKEAAEHLRADIDAQMKRVHDHFLKRFDAA